MASSLTVCIWIQLFLLCRLRRTHGKSITWREWPMKCTLSTCPVPLWGFHFLQFVSKYASALKHGSLQQPLLCIQTHCSKYHKFLPFNILPNLLQIWTVKCPDQMWCDTLSVTNNLFIHTECETVAWHSHSQLEQIWCLMYCYVNQWDFMVICPSDCTKSTWW